MESSKFRFTLVLTKTTIIMTHTKGNWEIKPVRQLGIEVKNAFFITAKRKEVALVNYHKEDSVSKAKANAKLIAAAPELLEALRDINNMCNDAIRLGLEFDPKEVMRNASEAIQKATS